MFLRTISSLLAARYVALGLQFATNIFIARVLTPHEIGTNSIAMALVGLVSVFRDFGLSSYLVTAGVIDDRDTSAAHTLSLGLGASLALAVWLGADAIGAFYANPGVSVALKWLALNVVVIAANAVRHALLVRSLQNTLLARLEIVQACLYAVIAPSAALSGASFLSLVFASLASNVLLGIAYRYLGRPTYRTTLRLRGCRSIAQRSLPSALTNLIDFGADRSPELSLGRTQDAATVGIFDRGVGLVDMFRRIFLDAVSIVLLPYLSSAAGNDARVIADRFERINRVVCAGSAAFFALSFAISTQLVVAIYGDAWAQSGEVAAVLCIAGTIAAPTFFARHVLMGTEAHAALLRFYFVSRGLSLVLVVVGASGGILVTAWVLVLSAVLALGMFAWTTRAWIPARVWLETLWIWATVGLPVGVVAWGLERLAGANHFSAMGTVLLTSPLALAVFVWISSRHDFWGVDMAQVPLLNRLFATQRND